ncbi:MAG TPA: hypothetical protein VEM96_17350 [Pyrinomonadaceae bacterium]|nr:hypothetical protein [Pyrinomonadaceae bacterium]
MLMMIANDFSVIEDACTGLVDAALPPDVRHVCDVPSKVQYLFLGLCPPVGTEPLEIGLKNRLEGKRPAAHLGAEPLV